MGLNAGIDCDIRSDAASIAGDVLSAARRLGFRRRSNIHPVESVDDPALAVSALGVAFLDLAAMPTADQLAELKSSLMQHLAVSEVTADEMMIVGRWLVTECKGADSAITRLTKRLYTLDKTGFQPVLAVMGDVSNAAGGNLSPRQRDALDEVARIFRLH